MSRLLCTLVHQDFLSSFTVKQITGTTYLQGPPSVSPWRTSHTVNITQVSSLSIATNRTLLGSSSNQAFYRFIATPTVFWSCMELLQSTGTMECLLTMMMTKTKTSHGREVVRSFAELFDTLFVIVRSVRISPLYVLPHIRTFLDSHRMSMFLRRALNIVLRRQFHI